jgi:hypothetical protein
MNIAATTAAEGLPRRVFTVDDISRMIDALARILHSPG